MAAAAVRRDIAAGCDLVVLSKFGKLEAGGGGLRDAFGAAIEAGVPVLIVPGNHERGRIPYPLLASHPKLHVFDRPRTFVIEARGVRVAFAGFPYARSVRARFPELLAATARSTNDGAPPRAPDHSILCLHHCIEGATCGPGDFTFRGGDDVIRRAHLTRRFALVLSGHIHRHQVMRWDGGPTVVYAGSIERTSFAEAPETKGVVRVELDPTRVTRLSFSPLATRPMIVRALVVDGCGRAEVRRRVAEVLAATPSDAIVQRRFEGNPSAAEWLSAAALRELAVDRNVTLVAPWMGGDRANMRVPHEVGMQLGLFRGERPARPRV